MQKKIAVVRSNFTGFYAIVTDTSDTSRMNELDELNHLKRSFGKWVANENKTDSRGIKDLVQVRGHVDEKFRYTIIE